MSDSPLPDDPAVLEETPRAADVTAGAVPEAVAPDPAPPQSNTRSTDQEEEPDPTPAAAPTAPSVSPQADDRTALMYREGHGSVGLPTRNLTAAEVWVLVGSQEELDRISGSDSKLPYWRTPYCPTLPPYQRRKG